MIRFMIFFIFLLLLILSLPLKAQRKKRLLYREYPSMVLRNKKYFSVDTFVGGLNYFGDLAPKNQLGSTCLPLTRAGFGVTGAYRLQGPFFLRGGFMWGRLLGDDFTSAKKEGNSKFRYTRNLHFRNDIKEFSLDLMVEFLNPHRVFVSRQKVSPYLFFGLVVFHHNPKAKVPEKDALHYDVFDARPIKRSDPRYGGVTPGEWIALKPLGTEGQNIPGSAIKPYSNWQFAIPAGIGVRFRINSFLDGAFETGVRQTFTDYLDDVSAYYLNPEAFGKGPKANLSRLMADRSKEPVAAVAGVERDLEYILINVHDTASFGRLPEEFGTGSYAVIEGFGKEGIGNIRGKEAFDIYVVTKLIVRFYLQKDFRH